MSAVHSGWYYHEHCFFLGLLLLLLLLSAAWNRLCFHGFFRRLLHTSLHLFILLFCFLFLVWISCYGCCSETMRCIPDGAIKTWCMQRMLIILFAFCLSSHNLLMMRHSQKQQTNEIFIHWKWCAFQCNLWLPLSNDMTFVFAFLFFIIIIDGDAICGANEWYGIHAAAIFLFMLDVTARALSLSWVIVWRSQYLRWWPRLRVIWIWHIRTKAVLSEWQTKGWWMVVFIGLRGPLRFRVWMMLLRRTQLGDVTSLICSVYWHWWHCNIFLFSPERCVPLNGVRQPSWSYILSAHAPLYLRSTINSTVLSSADK